MTEPQRKPFLTSSYAWSYPRADAIAVVPATFNTVNKWAAGFVDNLAPAAWSPQTQV